MNKSQLKSGVNVRATLVAQEDISPKHHGRERSPVYLVPTASEKNLIRACCLEGKESLESFKLWLAEGYDQSDLPFHLHRIIPILFLKVPPFKEFDQIRERYRAVCRHTWASNTIRMNYTRQAIDQLTENGITAALHSEILASYVGYQEIGHRFIQDAEVLISPPDKSRALRLLSRIGWNESEFHQPKLLDFKHCASVCRGKGESLRVQWYLFEEYRNNKSQSKLMESLETIKFCGRPCKAIPVNTLFYQTFISSDQTERDNLSRLIDLFFILRNFPDKIDLTRIGQFAQESHRQRLREVCDIFEWVFESRQLRPLKLKLAVSPVSAFCQRTFISPIVRSANRLNLYSGFYKPLP